MIPLSYTQALVPIGPTNMNFKSRVKCSAVTHGG